MGKFQSFIEQLGQEQNILLNDIPEIDLYMDQVIQLFENKFNDTKRNEDEKILTKTMINNYAKGKLLFPIKNKKYSKEHIILISLIYQLKGALSIKDIQATLQGINERIEGNLNLESFYDRYLQESAANTAGFTEDIQARMEKTVIEEEEYLSKVLLISSDRKSVV